MISVPVYRWDGGPSCREQYDPLERGAWCLMLRRSMVDGWVCTCSGMALQECDDGPIVPRAGCPLWA